MDLHAQEFSYYLSQVGAAGASRRDLAKSRLAYAKVKGRPSVSAMMLATPFVEAPADHSGVSRDLALFFPLLNRLRFLAQKCRADARLDLTEACSAIHAERSTSLDRIAESMIRVISQAVEGHVVFLAPGSPHMTFDEEWLVRLLDRGTAKDTVSVEFLLRRRVAPRHHHAFRSIVRAVAALNR